MRFLGLIVAMYAATALAADPQAAFDLRGYAVIPLHRGINPVNAGLDGQAAIVVIGHRENFNAHSFNVVTFYLTPAGPQTDSANPWPEFNIVGLFDTHPDGSRIESQFVTVGGGADCVVHDFRLLRSAVGLPPALVIASRPVLHSYADPDPVTFSVYVLMRNTTQDSGVPEYWFKLEGTRLAGKQYCDVGDSFSHELGLSDYRVPPVIR
jgi:hypothetical protein